MSEPVLIGDLKERYSVIEEGRVISQSEREKMLDNFYEYRTSSSHPQVIENMTSSEVRNSIIHELILMLEIQDKTSQLATNEMSVVVKNSQIAQVQADTDNTYKKIYAILVGVLVVVLLGIVSYIKPILGLNDSLYKMVMMILILSYLFYFMYLFNIMYVQDSIDKIFGFVRKNEVKVKLGIPEMNPLPRDQYMKQLCMKKAPKKEEDSAEATNPTTTIISPGDVELNQYQANDRYYYNDGNTPKKQLYPTKDYPEPAQYVYDVDYDLGRKDGGQLVQTSGL